MTADQPGPVTPSGVLTALARACRDLGIPYGARPDGDSDRWIVVEPKGPNAALVAVIDDSAKPKILAAFEVTLTPVAPPRPTAPDGVPHQTCPATTTYGPHPGHLWHKTGAGGWETVTAPTADSKWCENAPATN